MVYRPRTWLQKRFVALNGCKFPLKHSKQCGQKAALLQPSYGPMALLSLVPPEVSLSRFDMNLQTIRSEASHHHQPEESESSSLGRFWLSTNPLISLSHFFRIRRPMTHIPQTRFVAGDRPERETRRSKLRRRQRWCSRSLALRDRWRRKVPRAPRHLARRHVRAAATQMDGYPVPTH